MIGQTVVEELFSGERAVGQNVKVNGSNFEVVGVLAAKGSNGASNQDDVVMAPISTVQDSLTGFSSIDSITVQATSQSALNAAEAEVTQTLEERHKIKDAAEPGFEVLNQGSLLETSSSTSSVFTTLLGEVAAISLLVGGIGVMNIMLVSVTERTREIGIRKAIGARRSDILTQFLTEAVLVSLIGGIAGVLLGVDRQSVPDRRRPPGDRDVLDLPCLRRGSLVRSVLRHLPSRARGRAQTDRGAAL